MDSTFDAPQYNKHLDRLIGEQSVRRLEEIHQHPKLKENFEIVPIKWPRIGSFSYLKPMIDENDNSVIGRVKPSDLDCILPLANKSSASKHSTKFNELQLEIYSLLASYKDLLYTNQVIESIEDIQQAYVLHVLKHLMDSRSKILSNNKVFERKTLSDKVVYDDPKLRDQGFTRPRVLFLLPFRYSALRLGQCIVKFLGDAYNINYFDRFIREFGDEDGTNSCLRPVASDGHKPHDYYQTFHGNTDDAFRVGLKLTKKSVKFFADFYDSDIIIASPLGLKTIISPDEHQSVMSGESEQIPAAGDRDFLSSIEIIILEQAEVFLMQNWEHVIDIMQHINATPMKQHKMDVNRIRLWHLENWSKYYRQLIMFTSVTVPLIHSFFQTFSFNYEGYSTSKHKVIKPQVKHVTSKCRQQFLFYDSTSAKEACDERFAFFTKQILPKCANLGGNKEDESREQLNHTLIMVSSYFDYVRLRNHFRREKLSFTQICEYTEDNKVAKARQLFYFGARQFLLYTERCHFYHRYKIKGIRNIIFYEPPTFAKFYTEMLNMLTSELQGKKFVENSTQFTATTLFSNHDTLQLGSIVGYSNAVKLIQNKRSIT